MSDMAISKKPRKKPTPKEIIHVCNKETTIERQGVLLERLSLVTLGNGTPENGLLFMFRAYLEKHKDDDTHLKEIKSTIQEAIDSSTHTAKALEIYRAEMEGVAIGKKEIEGKEKEKIERDVIAENLKIEKETLKRSYSRDTWYRILTIIGIAVAIYFGVRNDRKNDTIMTTTKTTENEVRNQGIPFVVNSRGEFIALPDSTLIKFLPKDSVEYFIMKNIK